MTEWLYAQRISEVHEEQEEFKTNAHYDLMQILIDVREDSNPIAYNKVNDLLLETTSKAYGHERTIEEINEDIPLKAGLVMHSNEIIKTEAMNNYKADPTNIDNLNGLLNSICEGLSPDRFVINESSENIINYLTNSIDYHSEVEGENQIPVKKVIVGLMNRLITKPDHLAYLSENPELIEQISDKLERTELIDLVNGALPEMGVEIGVESLEELIEYLN